MPKPKAKAKIYYRILQSKPHGYAHTHVDVFQDYESSETHLADLIERCTDNAAGYQSQDIADKQAERFKQARALGFATLVQGFHTLAHVSLDWQHYNPGPPQQYCDAHITFSERHYDLQRDLKFWATLRAAVIRENDGRSYGAFDSPDPLLRTLHRWRAIRLYEVRLKEPGTTWDWVEWGALARGVQPPADQPQYTLAV